MSLDKTPIEQQLFNKWIGYIKSFHIPKIKIAEYRRDLKRAGFAVMMVVSFGINAQSGIVAAGNNTETIGEVFPIMQQMDTLIQASLGIPKFEIPIEQPKPIVKKENWLIKLLKIIFNIK